jgi:cobalt-zinc-cadmium efflux system outer membrane protein
MEGATDKNYAHGPSVVLAVISCLLFCNSALAEGKGTTESLTQFIGIAQANNPDLKAAESRWQMFRSRIDQASSFEDPMLMLRIQNGVVSDPLNFAKEPMTSKAIGLSQRFPFWGKRSLKGEVATKEADSYGWMAAERKVELTRMVKESWFRLYYIQKSTEIIDKNIQTLDRFIALAKTRYSIGKGSQTDVLKAQLGRSHLFDMKITLEQQHRTAESTLNTILYRPMETPIGKIQDFATTPIEISEKDLRSMAYANRPWVKSLSAQIGKGEAGLRLAEREFYPDFTVSLEYMQRVPVMGGQGNDLYTLGVSFNLPVQRDRRHAAVAESDAEITVANEELAALKNNIDFGISDLLAQLNRREKLIELYKTGIIPQAEQTLDSATINYRVNKVDFLTLLDSQVTLLSFEREYYESLAEHQKMLAQLEALVGKELGHD